MLSQELLDQLLEFRRERDWEQFHTPRNLAAAVTTEAAELLEIFRWANDATLDQLVTENRPAIEAEVADIAILLSYLCHDLGIDLDAAARAKLARNRERYPADTSRGNAARPATPNPSGREGT